MAVARRFRWGGASRALRCTRRPAAHLARGPGGESRALPCTRRATGKRHRGDSNPCGQSPMDFESISLTARTQCLDEKVYRNWHQNKTRLQRKYGKGLCKTNNAICEKRRRGRAVGVGRGSRALSRGQKGHSSGRHFRGANIWTSVRAPFGRETLVVSSVRLVEVETIAPLKRIRPAQRCFASTARACGGMGIYILRGRELNPGLPRDRRKY